MSNQLKGYQYEIQIRDYIINTLNKPAYLWTDTPETILIQNNIIGSHNINRLKRKEHKINPLQDTGIDIIQLEENKCSLVQCKNGYKKGLKMEDLAGFNAWMSALDTLSGYVYYTDKLSQNIISLPKNKRIEYIKQPFQQDIIKENISEYQPYDYQTEALNKFIAHFEINNRGILSMPCGTGKTYTSYMISEQYSQIIMISPLREFAKQNLNRYIEYGYKNNTLLVSSDGLRDIEEIKKFIQSNNKFLISSTFCSIDCIRQILEYCNNPLIIIDEFHNLSKNNIVSEEDDFYNILNANHKIMFMSATPRVYELEDELYDPEYIFGTVFYNMSFTEAINKKYITDYKIWLPSIHEDNSKLEEELSIYEIDNAIKAKCNFFFSCLLNNGSKKCIIYCMDTNEITNMIDAMNKLNDYFCLDYKTNQITASNTNKQREDILSEFTTSNNIYLLFSIRILDECIDIPSCDSIFITYPTKSKIRTIQRLSRCIRTNKLNLYKIGNIYIWTDEYDKILDTLSGIKEYDMFFKDKIKLNIVGFYDNDIKEGVKTDDKLIENYIMGVKEFRFISWTDKLDMVKKYIDEHHKRPPINEQLGKWLSHNLTNYNQDIYSMNDNNNKQLFTHFFEQYKQYFLSNIEEWEIKFNQLIEYVETNKLKPYPNTVLYNWLSAQNQNYKQKRYIMKNIVIYDKWTDFIEKYKEYLLTEEETFIIKLNEVKQYIDTHKKKPEQQDIDKNISRMASWISSKQSNYIQKTYCMKNETIYNLWTEFYNNYKVYIFTLDDKWTKILNQVKLYIDTNKKRPSEVSNDMEVSKLGGWVQNQFTNYKKNIKSMNNTERRTIWEQFINEYKTYFMNNNLKWVDMLEKVKTHIDMNKKRPSCTDKDTYVAKLGKWLISQTKNYKNKNWIMKEDIIYDIWKAFINDHKYNEYFLTDEDKWEDNFNKVKSYIDKNNKTPSSSDEDINIKYLGEWLSHNKQSYINKTKIMRDEIIYKKWHDFINNNIYNKYFITEETKWLNNLACVKKYIDEHKKRPNSNDIDEEIAYYGSWITHQDKNYRNKINIMKNENIYKMWEEFSNNQIYSVCFMSNEDNWKNKLTTLKKYIDDNNKMPSAASKNKDIKQLGAWIISQKQYYKKTIKSMNNSEIRLLWQDFINDDKYKIYFISNKEDWRCKLEMAKKYINDNNILLSSRTKLGAWFRYQSFNHIKKSQIMAEVDIYNEWTEFINDPQYKKYFE
jgi:superfamily II DNA or RNA helicase